MESIDDIRAFYLGLLAQNYAETKWYLIFKKVFS